MPFQVMRLKTSKKTSLERSTSIYTEGAAELEF